MIVREEVITVVIMTHTEVVQKETVEMKIVTHAQRNLLNVLLKIGVERVMNVLDGIIPLLEHHRLPATIEESQCQNG